MRRQFREPVPRQNATLPPVDEVWWRQALRALEADDSVLLRRAFAAHEGKLNIGISECTRFGMKPNDTWLDVCYRLHRSKEVRAVVREMGGQTFNMAAVEKAEFDAEARAIAHAAERAGHEREAAQIAHEEKEKRKRPKTPAVPKSRPPEVQPPPVAAQSAPARKRVQIPTSSSPSQSVDAPSPAGPQLSMEALP